jgi:hypothetical protein
MENGRQYITTITTDHDHAQSIAWRDVTKALLLSSIFSQVN